MRLFNASAQQKLDHFNCFEQNPKFYPVKRFTGIFIKFNHLNKR